MSRAAAEPRAACAPEATSTLHRCVVAMGIELMRRRLAGRPVDPSAQREALRGAARQTRAERGAL